MRLYKASDAFMENNAAGTMEKLGLTYEALKDVNPGMVHVNMPSYGITGPYKYYMGFGDQAEALAGQHWLRGFPSTDWPFTNSAVFHMDSAGGAGAAYAVLLGLWHRNKTGKGVHFDIAQIQAVLTQTAEPFMDNAWNGRDRQSMGNRHISAVQGVYRCRGEDRWVAITINDDEEWRAFCNAIGNPEWTEDKRFANSVSRYQNHDELDRLIEEWTSHQDHINVMHILQEHGVPAGAVLG